MATIYSSPNGNYTHRLDVTNTGQVSGTKRKVHAKYLVDVKVSGAAGSWSGTATRLFRVTIDGVKYEARKSFDTRNGADFIALEFDAWVTVGSTSRNVPFSLYFEGWSSAFPAASASGSISLAAVTSVPATPAKPTASAITQTGMTISWVIPANGGSPIDRMLIRRYDSAAAASAGGPHVDYNAGATDVSKVITGLTPGVPYVWAVYAHNAAGYSARSPLLTQATSSGNAPGMTVTPSASGFQATVNLTPPSGMTGVTQYSIQRRYNGLTNTETTTTGTRTYYDMSPGRIYEWRASAWVGTTYQSPWTEWTPVAQPNPGANPGDYFDGAMADKADTTYDWEGTAGLSKSNAFGKGVLGWDATFLAPCEGEMSRVTGGASGTYSARVIITHDADEPGQVVAGMKIHATGVADAEGESTYTGQIGVKPSKTQLMAAMVTWVDGTMEPIESVIGEPTLIPAGLWAQLFVTAMSVPGTEYAVVRALDVEGDGQENWECGDWFQLDQAMIMLGGEVLPWFSGDTADGANYVYAWSDDANESESYRTTVAVEVTDPLTDPDCPPLPAPPLPPVITSDCIEEVGSWNRYAVDIDKADVPLFGSTVPSLILSTAGSTERQVRIRFYPNPDDLPPNAVNMEAGYDAELILTYIPPFAEITLDGVTQRVWAEVRGAAPRTADHLLYGTGGVPAVWPELRCGIGYVVSLDTPLEAPAGNLSTRVLLTQRV